MHKSQQIGLRKNIEKRAKRIKKKNLKENHKGELPGRYTTKLLYRQNDKKFDREDQKGIGDNRDQKEQRKGKH